MHIRNLSILLGIIMVSSLTGCYQGTSSTPIANNNQANGSSGNQNTNSTPAQLQKGLLNGTVELAGTCGNMPVLPNGNNTACQSRPHSTKVMIFKKGDDTPTQTLQSDQAGRFSVKLAPRAYRVETAKSPFMSSALQKINIQPGQTHTVLLSVNARLP